MLPVSRRLMPTVLLTTCAFAPAVYAKDLSEIIPGLIVIEPEDMQPNGGHEAHFNAGADPRTEGAVNAFNSSVAAQLATYPVSSSSGGFNYVFDSATGAKQRVTETFGPIFAERGLTMGKGNINAGVLFMSSSSDAIDGIDLEDRSLVAQLKHEAEPTVQDYQNDVIQTELSLKLDLNTALFFANYGFTDNLDLGIVLPIVKTTLEATAYQTIFPFGSAPPPSLPPSTDWDPSGSFHKFAGGALTRTLTEDESASGLGDIMLRSKYTFFRPKLAGAGLAAALDLRLRTGDEKNYLGTGANQAKLYFIGSFPVGIWDPHVNVGYTYSSGGLGDVQVPDEIDYTVGVDVAAHRRLTVAADFLGRTLLDTSRISVESTPFAVGAIGGGLTTPLPQLYASEDYNETLLTGALGVKYNPTKGLLLSLGVLVPVTDDGLTSKFSVALGLDYSF